MAIGVILGNGRYTSMRMPGVRHFDVPKMIAQLEVYYEDGEKRVIASDASWKITAEGPSGQIMSLTVKSMMQEKRCRDGIHIRLMIRSGFRQKL